MTTELISESLIDVNLSATQKDEVFEELAELLDSQGRLHDKEKFLADICEREALDNTGFENSVAIPHARSRAVKEAGIAIGISPAGIEYGIKHHRTHLFFMIASPIEATAAHIQILTNLFAKLLDKEVVAQLRSAQTPQEVVELLKEDISTEKAPNKGLIIGVTGCPAGIAHTYLSARAIEKAAKRMGYEVKVETNGSVGVRNSPTPEDIQRAVAVVVSCDKEVDLTRFDGKKLVRTNVKKPINDGKELIEKALAAEPFNANDANSAPEHNKKQGLSGLFGYLKKLWH